MNIADIFFEVYITWYDSRGHQRRSSDRQVRIEGSLNRGDQGTEPIATEGIVSDLSVSWLRRRHVVCHWTNRRRQLNNLRIPRTKHRLAEGVLAVLLLLLLRVHGVVCRLLPRKRLLLNVLLLLLIWLLLLLLL